MVGTQYLARLVGILSLVCLASSSPSSSSLAIQWINCSTSIPQPLLEDPTFTIPAVLPSTLKCGRLNVPMDYTKPIAKDNQITLGFAMNRPKNPQGLLNLYVACLLRMLTSLTYHFSNPGLLISS